MPGRPADYADGFPVSWHNPYPLIDRFAPRPAAGVAIPRDAGLIEPVSAVPALYQPETAMAEHACVDLRRAWVACRCGWQFHLEEPGAMAHDKDRLLDAYNAHRAARDGKR